MARVIVESRVRAVRRKRLLLRAVLLLLVLLALMGGVVWLSRAAALRINTIEVAGAQTLPTSTIEAYAAQKISGTYWYLFPKNNIFLYPKGAIEEGLLNTIPALAQVGVHALNFTTIEVNVVERQPKALWCGAQVASSTSCFLLDQNGVAYAQADTFSGDAYERYFGALASASTTNALPQSYLDPAQFEALSALVDALTSQSATDTPQSVQVDHNRDVYVAYQSGFQLIFSLGDAGGDVYQRFKLALQSPPFAGKTLSDFQYLDLRFGDKLYYKLK